MAAMSSRLACCRRKAGPDTHSPAAQMRVATVGVPASRPRSARACTSRYRRSLPSRDSPSAEPSLHQPRRRPRASSTGPTPPARPWRTPNRRAQASVASPESSRPRRQASARWRRASGPSPLPSFLLLPQPPVTLLRPERTAAPVALLQPEQAAARGRASSVQRTPGWPEPVATAALQAPPVPLIGRPVARRVAGARAFAGARARRRWPEPAPLPEREVR